MIIRHDRSDRDCLVDERQWPALTSLFRGHGAASLITPTWLLTAAHVAQLIPTEVSLSVELAGKRYPLARTICHPAYDHAWMDVSSTMHASRLSLIGYALFVTSDFG